MAVLMLATICFVAVPVVYFAEYARLIKQERKRRK